jgi:hypothetical protein
VLLTRIEGRGGSGARARMQTYRERLLARLDRSGDE